MIGWIGMSLALIGSALVAYGIRTGFAFFLASNAVLFVRSLLIEDVPLTVMFAMFAITSVIGLCRNPKK